MWGKAARMIVHEDDPYNAETPRDTLLDPTTPVDAFYVRNHGPVPELAEDWRLRVDGMVERPLTLTLGDLRARWPEHTVTATMQCAGNRRADLLEVRDIPGEAPWGPGATSTARWTGVRLADVLAAAGAGAAARHVAFAAPDVSQLADPAQPFGASIPLEKARSHEVLLAWAMNGAPLPAAHGAPLRVVVPGYIGARSVKWLDRITVQDMPSANYFQAVAYRLLPADADPETAGPDDGPELGSVALNCAVLRPAPGDDVHPGPVEIAGYAHAGDDRSVVRVDVAVDDGPWRQARLAPPPSPWSWHHWQLTVDLTPGEHTVVARAWDSTGALQPEQARHLWNPKGYVNNSWDRVRLNARD